MWSLGQAGVFSKCLGCRFTDRVWGLGFYESTSCSPGQGPGVDDQGKIRNLTYLTSSRARRQQSRARACQTRSAYAFKVQQYPIRETKCWERVGILSESHLYRPNAEEEEDEEEQKEEEGIGIDCVDAMK